MRHKYISFKKQYGRYSIVLTQHIYAGKGLKKHGHVDWVVLLDDEHILLNEHTDVCREKVTEAHMDMFFDDFMIRYGKGLNIYSKTQNEDLIAVEFAKHSDKLVDDKITIKDIDKLLEDKEQLENKIKTFNRKINKLEKKFQDLLSELKNL